MDDGYSPVGILLLIGFILLEAAFYGFGSAIQNMDEDELEEEAGKGDAAAARMLRVIENPANLINTIQIDRKSTRQNSSHIRRSRMPSSA